jgi:hypothetical protein
MATKRVYPSDITRACTALQVAVYEYAAVRGKLSDEQAIASMKTCSEQIGRLVKTYIKQESE